MLTKKSEKQSSVELQESQPNSVDRECLRLPSTDVRFDDRDIYLESELTGVNKDTLEISWDEEDHILTIYGKTKPVDTKGYELEYAEFNSASFRRQFRIEGNADAEQIQAQIRQGVLKLHIPLVRSEIKKIKIQEAKP